VSSRRFCITTASLTGRSSCSSTVLMKRSGSDFTGSSTSSSQTARIGKRSPSTRQKSKSMAERSTSKRQSSVRRSKCYLWTSHMVIQSRCVAVFQRGAQAGPRSPACAGRPRSPIRLAARPPRVRYCA
jgi:hypothetical protein